MTIEEMRKFTAYIVVVLLFMGSMTVDAQKDPEAEPYLNKIAKDLDPGSSLGLDFD